MAAGTFGGGRDHGMDDLGLAIDADVSSHLEVPRVSLARLVPVGASILVPILRGRRGPDEGGIDDRALGDVYPLGLPMAVDLRVLLAQVGFLKEMAKRQDGGLVRHGFVSQIDTDEGTQGLGIVQSFFRGGIGEIEREEGNSEHALTASRRPAVLALGIVGLDHRTEIPPGRHFLPNPRGYLSWRVRLR